MPIFSSRLSASVSTRETKKEATLCTSLGLPPEASLVTVDRTNHHISIGADYVETVELPLHVGHINFSPRAEYHY